MALAELVHSFRGKFWLESHLGWLSANVAWGWDFLHGTSWCFRGHTWHACFAWIAESFALRCLSRVWIGTGIHNQKTTICQQQTQQQTTTHGQPPAPIDSHRGPDAPEPPRRVKQKRWSLLSTLVMHPTIFFTWTVHLQKKTQDGNHEPKCSHV